MKYVTIFFMMILLFGGVLVSCEDPDDGDDDVVVIEGPDPCETTPNCIPDMSDWKLHYKPKHAYCTQCHTGCLPKHDIFCAEDDTWTVMPADCMKCHRIKHQ